jgi:phytoene synthase
MTAHHAKTFYFASHALPARKRADAYAVYAFCRHVDDRIDLAPDEATRLAGFAELRTLLADAYDFARPPAEAEALPWLEAFRETAQRRAIPRSYFEDLLAGVEMDRGPVRIQNWEELDRYCYHVAGVVGLIMVHVLSEPAPELLRPARGCPARPGCNRSARVQSESASGRGTIPTGGATDFTCRSPKWKNSD